MSATIPHDNVQMATDGSCKGNPGPGGWAAVIIDIDGQRILTGGDASTTNNRMELTAVIEGMRAIEKRSVVSIIVDSRYVMDGITNWIRRWLVGDWKNADGKKIANQDLWESLLEQVSRHEVEWTWVKGHSGHTMNSIADASARQSVPLFSPNTQSIGNH